MSRQGYSDQGDWGSDAGRFGAGRQGGSSQAGRSGGGMSGQAGFGQASGGQAGGGQSGAGQGRGNFAGRGPRGYRRGDDRIGADICEALTADPDIDASDIDVIVTEGVVTLIGVVDDRDAKRRAEDISDQVPGVTDVNNQLRLEGQQQQGDPSRGQGQPGRQAAGDGGSRAAGDRGNGGARAPGDGGSRASGAAGDRGAGDRAAEESRQGGAAASR
jgi:osmotically-inducible protein OsmY